MKEYQMNKQDKIEFLYLNKEIDMQEKIEMMNWTEPEVNQIYNLTKEIMEMQKV